MNIFCRLFERSNRKCPPSPPLFYQMQSQWQIYLTQCIETIALVAEVQPVQVFEQVYAEWRKPFEIFTTMHKSIDPNGRLIIEDLQRTHLLFAVLQDLSSLCQTLTRLTPILQGLFLSLIFIEARHTFSLNPVTHSRANQFPSFPRIRLPGRSTKTTITNDHVPYVRDKIHCAAQIAFVTLRQFDAWR